MDLFEYQARDLFESYGVPVLKGIVADTPEEAKAAAEAIGGTVVVKAQVKTGGRGKAGGVKVVHNPEDAATAAEAILGLDIKGHIVKRVMVAQGAAIDKEYYFSVLLDRANRSYLSLCSVEGGMEIEELAVERPEALAKIEVDPIKGIDLAKATEIALAGGFDRGCRGQGRPRARQALRGLRRRGRDARRGQPARAHQGRRRARPRRQGHARRERRVPSPGARSARGCRGRRPPRGEGQGARPQLREARRRGGDHRQRRRSRDVHPRRGELRGGAVRRREARQLPRHRRWGIRRGDGGRAST